MNHFDVLLILARPAAGKSEIIKFLSGLPPEIRQKEYFLGNLVVLDDFPILWRWFEEDELLEKMGKPRLYTDDQGYFKDKTLWHLLVKLLILDYQKLMLKQKNLHTDSSVIIEFSRGSEHGGYREAFWNIPDEVLSRAAVLYVNVPWEESFRKNRRRYNPDNADSILEHSVPDEKMRRLYFGDDWQTLAGDPFGFISVNGCQVPYAVFENTDDVTTRGGYDLAKRLKETLQDLWSIYFKRTNQDS